jgi:hypothetical protein
MKFFKLIFKIFFPNSQETNWLMLYREAVTLSFENHIKERNTLCEQTAEFLNVQADGSYSNCCAQKGYY